MMLRAIGKPKVIAAWLLLLWGVQTAGLGFSEASPFAPNTIFIQMFDRPIDILVLADTPASVFLRNIVKKEQVLRTGMDSFRLGPSHSTFITLTFVQRKILWPIFEPRPEPSALSLGRNR